MAKLTDTAAIILTAAAARDNCRVLPLPTSLKAPPPAVQKVLKSLLAGGMIEEVAATAQDETWQQTDESGRVTLVVTAAGLRAIGIEETSERPSPADEGIKAPKVRTRGPKSGGGATVPKTASRAHTGADGKKISKQDTVIGLLRRANGATVEEMMTATDWLAHSVRGFMSGALKRRLGIDVVSEKDVQTGERRYYVAALKSSAD